MTPLILLFSLSASALGADPCPDAGSLETWGEGAPSAVWEVLETSEPGIREAWNELDEGDRREELESVCQAYLD